MEMIIKHRKKITCSEWGALGKHVKRVWLFMGPKQLWYLTTPSLIDRQRWPWIHDWGRHSSMAPWLLLCSQYTFTCLGLCRLIPSAPRYGMVCWRHHIQPIRILAATHRLCGRLCLDANELGSKPKSEPRILRITTRYIPHASWSPITWRQHEQA